MLKKLAIGLVALVIIAGVAIYAALNRPYTPAQTFETRPATNMADAPNGPVWFPSFHAMKGADLLDGGKSAVAEPVSGTLVLPQGASAGRPVPVFIILHGSSGDFTGRSLNLAKKLAAVGIAGFAVDSFGARGLTAEDGYVERLQKVSVYTQIADAYNALKALEQHPFIRKDRIGVTGFSLGATAAGFTMFEQLSEPMLGTGGPRFAAHVMFYTGANFDFEDFRTDKAPVMLMIGGMDETTPKDKAEALIGKLADAGHATELKVYAAAGHGWDLPFPQAYRSDSLSTANCRTLWKKDGSIIEANSGKSLDSAFGAMTAFSKCASRGYTIGRNDDANRKAVKDMLKFIEAQWGGDYSSPLTDEILSTGIPVQ